MTHADRLADVLWYLEGYIDASEHAAAVCIFDQEHIEALKEAHRGLSAPVTVEAKRELCTCHVQDTKIMPLGPDHKLECACYSPPKDACTCACAGGPHERPGVHHRATCACHVPF